jgi:PAS domain S-box-containing protein
MANLAELRKRAEAQLKPETLDAPDMSREKACELIHELRTHQIELEMQNEELRRTQQELIESRDRYSDLYEFAPVGYVTVSDKGLILEANLTLADMLAVERGRLVKQRLSAFIIPDDEDIFYLHTRRLLETEGRQTCELRMQKDGTEPFWAKMESVAVRDAAGNAAGYRTAISDVTRPKQAEDALRQLNEELESKVAERTKTLRENRDFIRRISDASTYLLWVYDLNGEDFVHINKSFAQFLDLPTDADFPLAGKMADRLIHPDDVPIHAAYRERSLKAKDGESLDRELRVKDRAGEWRWFLARSVVLNRNPDGSPRQLLGTAVDVTERKEIERQLQQRTAELARFARVSTVGEMASGLAHQLNQPLVAISLQSEVCAKLLERMDEGHDLDELRDAFREITLQAQRAGGFVGFVKGFVRDQPPRRSTHDLHEVIRGVMQVFDGEARRAGVDIRYQPAADLPCVVIDRFQIEQVIIILLRNAIDATEEIEPSDRFVVIGTESATQESVQVSVCDRGKGIAESDLDRVFESFFTTKAHGMGLGLSICRTIVEAHEGRLWVTRNPDRGVTFRFTIPCSRVSGEPEV